MHSEQLKADVRSRASRPRGVSRSFSRLVACSIAGVVLVLAGAASAAERKVALGEVSAGVAPVSVDLVRRTAEAELDQLDLSHAGKKERAILSLSVVRMDTRADDKNAAVTCVVSATLRTVRGGRVFAILEGRARAENDASNQKSLEASAVRAAVRGAMVHIPEALE